MKSEKQNIIVIVITIITIIMWIAGNLYHISVTSTLPDDVQQTVLPFNPVLDTKLIDSIKNKKGTQDFVISQVTASASATPTITITQEASGAATNQ